MNDSRPNEGQVQTVVFVLLIIAALAVLVVGSSAGSSPTTTATKATLEVPTEVAAAPVAEATTEATTAPVAEATAEATTEAAAPIVEGAAEVTPEAAAPIGEGAAEITPEATSDAAPVQRVFFASPADGATVPATFTVEMGAEGLTIEPAGDVHEHAGHFHILIDAPFIEPGEIIPKDDTHLHFGQAQTSAELTLTPGDHVLRLQFADGAHTALEGDQYRAEITVHVE